MRKTRIYRALVRLLMLLTLPAVAGAFIYAAEAEKKASCQEIAIRFTNAQHSFVTRNDVMQLLEKNHIAAGKTVVPALRLEQAEQHLKNNPWIESAEIYITSQHIVEVVVKQREPKIRVQHADSSEYAYYLDQQGNTIDWSEQYSPRLPIATVPVLGVDQRDFQLKSSLVTLANFIQTDSFWNAAIAQIVVKNNYEIQLIPVMGHQVIRLGDTRDLEDKMNRLLRFYQQGIHSLPWEKYDELDLRFKRQIVCRNLRGLDLTEDPYDEKSKAIVRKQQIEQKKQAVATTSGKAVNHLESKGHQRQKKDITTPNRKSKENNSTPQNANKNKKH